MPPWCESCVPFPVLGAETCELSPGFGGRVPLREPERGAGAEVVDTALLISCLIPRRLHVVKLHTASLFLVFVCVCVRAQSCGSHVVQN